MLLDIGVIKLGRRHVPTNRVTDRSWQPIRGERELRE